MHFSCNSHIQLIIARKLRQNTFENGERDQNMGVGQIKKRPILCKFSSWKIRCMVLNSFRQKAREKRQNKQTPDIIKISEDFSPEVRNVRKRLIQIMIEKRDEARTQGKDDFKCFLKYNKLIINDKAFTLNDENELIST